MSDMVRLEDCVNFTDIDPISLNEIDSLESPSFLLDSNRNGVEACDTTPWLFYISSNLPKRPVHPCTRKKLSNNDVWRIYTTAKMMPQSDICENSLKTLESRKLHIAIKSNNIRITTQSPLFTISMKKLQNVSDSEQIKIFQMHFDLKESNQFRKIIEKNKRLQIEAPQKFHIVGLLMFKKNQIIINQAKKKKKINKNQKFWEFFFFG